MMLSELASYIKSANAGATQITIDIGFRDPVIYRRVIEAGVLDQDRIAALYRIAAEAVTIYHYDPASTIKITVPRPTISGGLAETDFDGVQQYIPLLDLEIELVGANPQARLAE